jgi:hypothetical protein
MKKTFNKPLILMMLAVAAMLAACEKSISGDAVDDGKGNVRLTFIPTTADTRGSVNPADYFSKLNVQIFNEDGEKVFSSVKTQTKDDADFGSFTCELAPGEYTVVAVGHSSVKSATIKSPVMVQFTASDGEKLTDTFCYCGMIDVVEDGATHSLRMNRVGAMLRFRFTDTSQPEIFTKLKIDYTGGSANFNPTTMEGCTKSSQSETRQAPASEYRCFTFPYMATSCNLKVTLSAMNDGRTVLRQRVLTDVQVTRNRITTYTGKFFEDGDGVITQENFGITVNGDWEGEDQHTF